MRLMEMEKTMNECGDQMTKDRLIMINHCLDTSSFLADMVDAFLCDAESWMRSLGLNLTQNDKRNHSMLRDLVKKSRVKAKECYAKTFILTEDQKKRMSAEGVKIHEEKRIFIEDRADLLYNLFKLIVNRTTNENEGLQEIYNAVKELPIKRDVFDEERL